MSLTSTGVGALRAAQLGLSTIGNNISNVNTAGYRRQETVQTNAQPITSGSGFIGQGVNVTTVQRIYSEFAERAVSQNQSQASYLTQYQESINQVDSVLGDRSSGFSTAVEKFFTSWNDLASDPSSITARQGVISAGNTLADSINNTGNYLQSLQNSVNSEVQSIVTKVNSYASSIASLNDKINQLNGTGQPPNDLLDQRDQVVSQLSQLVGVTVLKDPSTGVYNLYLGSSYPLVSGTNVSTISAKPSKYDPTQTEVYDGGGNNVLSGNAVSGGQLGAILDYRKQVLDVAQNSLGRIADTLSHAVDVAHTHGRDLSGNVGGTFFTSSNTTQLFGNTSNTGTYTASASSIITPNQLTTENYTLSYNGAAWQVNRNSDGATVTIAGSGTVASPLTFDGLQVSFTGTPAAGDSFLLKPTTLASRSLAVAITDPTKIAAASAGGAAATGNQDNSNALVIAAYQSDKTLILGGTTIEDAYSSWVGQVGNKAEEVKINQQAQQNILDQAKQAQQAASGVNLDEEAANLLRYQQSYQAAAQIIKTANTIFDTLLSLKG